MMCAALRLSPEKTKKMSNKYFHRTNCHTQAFLPVERALYAAGMRDGDVVTLVDGLPATQETLAALGDKAHSKSVSTCSLATYCTDLGEYRGLGCCCCSLFLLGHRPTSRQREEDDDGGGCFVWYGDFGIETASAVFCLTHLQQQRRHQTTTALTVNPPRRRRPWSPPLPLSSRHHPRTSHAWLASS